MKEEIKMLNDIIELFQGMCKRVDDEELQNELLRTTNILFNLKLEMMTKSDYERKVS